MKLSDVSVVFGFVFFTANLTCKKKSHILFYFHCFSLFWKVLCSFVIGDCSHLAPPPFNDLPCTSPGPDWPALHINPGSSQTPLDDCCASRMCQNYLAVSSCGPQDNNNNNNKKPSALVELNSEVVNVCLFFPLKEAALLVCKYAAFFFSFLVSQLQCQFYQYDLETQCCCRLLFIYFSPIKMIFFVFCFIFFSPVIVNKRRCQT